MELFGGVDDQVQRAVVAFRAASADGLVMYYEGRYLSGDIEEGGIFCPDDLGMFEAGSPDRGIWIWEAKAQVRCYDHDYILQSWRELRADEWRALQRNENPLQLPNQPETPEDSCADGHSPGSLGVCVRCGYYERPGRRKGYVCREYSPKEKGSQICVRCYFHRSLHLWSGEQGDHVVSPHDPSKAAPRTDPSLVVASLHPDRPDWYVNPHPPFGVDWYGNKHF